MSSPAPTGPGGPPKRHAATRALVSGSALPTLCLPGRAPRPGGPEQMGPGGGTKAAPDRLMLVDEVDFTLRIYVEPPETLDDETLPTVPFERQMMQQLLQRESLRNVRRELNRRRRLHARKLLVMLGFGLPDERP